MLASLLIANRGEIACRIIATCRRLGVRTVAVYSEADRDARHVALADQAVLIGPAAARESYLALDRVLEAARRTGVEAVHPGYGFLAESPLLARRVREAGLIFVGPSAEAMVLMGGKDTAKRTVEEAGVPLVPGYHGADQSDRRLAAEAEAIGFPLLVKAVAGGGGKGMRRVDAAPDLPEALAACRREAALAFGDDHVLLERLVDRPRHVEVQVFADRHGNAVHLSERDCTLQRRHQKIIEESPAPDLAPGLREALGAAAVQAALASGYENAGTVEFLLDPEGRFFFIEMNTRLQVEHPVTEAITGQDLVEWQLRIASGEPLPLRQDEIRVRGHAVEARLYAEDPAKGFLPSTGRLRLLRLPEDLPGIRVDTGVREGDAVTPFYDPMIAKIVAHGPDRARALDLLGRALEATEVEGPATNVAFLQRVLRAEPYRRMAIDTAWLDREGALLAAEDRPEALDLALAALAVAEARREPGEAAGRDSGGDPTSPWHDRGGWRLNAPAARTVRFRELGPVTILSAGDHVELLVGGERWTARHGRAEGARWVEIDGRRESYRARVSGDAVALVRGGRRLRLALEGDDAAAGGEEANDALIAAPMPGKVTRLLAAAGDPVERGQVLAILEAMKMEHRVLAPRDGQVKTVHVAEGEQIEEGTDSSRSGRGGLSRASRDARRGLGVSRRISRLGSGTGRPGRRPESSTSSAKKESSSKASSRLRSAGWPMTSA